MLRRLITLGFPHTHLDIQQRMVSWYRDIRTCSNTNWMQHPALWAYPSLEFYGASNRNDPETERTLETVEPGLKTLLDGVIAKSLSKGRDGEQKRSDYIESATDEQTRLHYLDFGVQKVHRNGFKKSSMAIPKHIKAVFDLVFPAVQKHFGDRVNQEVMIVAAYGNAVCVEEHA